MVPPVAANGADTDIVNVLTPVLFPVSVVVTTTDMEEVPVRV